MRRWRLDSWGSPTICSNSIRKPCPGCGNVRLDRRILRASHCWLAATYAQLGNIEKARAEAAEALRIDPRWTIEGAGMRLNTFKRAEDAEHYFDGLRKAGLPER